MDSSRARGSQAASVYRTEGRSPLARIRSPRPVNVALDNIDMDTGQDHVFRPRPVRVMGWLVVSTAFVTGGILITSTRQWIGWLVIVFFGLGVMVFALQLLPNSNYVRVGPDGFTVCNLFRSHSCRWSDVGAFKVAQIGTKEMVVFSFSNQYRGPRRLSRLNAHLVGADAAVAISGSLNIGMHELADLLNRFRGRHGVV